MQCCVQISKVVGFKVQPKPESSLSEMNELGLNKYLSKWASFSYAYLLYLLAKQNTWYWWIILGLLPFIVFNITIWTISCFIKRSTAAPINPTISLIGWFLLVINTNLPPILHRFRDSLRKVKNPYIWLPLLRLTPDRGVLLDDLSKILPGCWYKY